MKIMRFHAPRRWRDFLAPKPFVRDDKEGPWVTYRQHKEIVDQLEEENKKLERVFKAAAVTLFWVGDRERLRENLQKMKEAIIAFNHPLPDDSKRFTEAQGESLLLAITTVSVAYQEEKMKLRKLQGLDTIESLCEAAHNAWMEEKKARGVTTWPNERGFEQLVPYDQCPEDVKEFDRVVIRAIAKKLIEEVG